MIDTPIYPDIYSFPDNKHYHYHQHNHDKHEIDKSYLVEPSKSILIMDSFGNSRYEVSLSSVLSSIDSTNDIRAYQITVRQFIYSPEGTTISAFMKIPDEGYELNYDKIQHDFDMCVQRYDSLVKAEMKDFRDIDIYKDKIQYEVLEPECCKNCKFSQLAKGCKHHMHMKLECHSPDNQQAFNYANLYPPFPNKNAHRYDGWKKLPWQKPDDVKYCNDDIRDKNHPYPIFPVVDPMGHCMHYKKRN